MNPLVGIDHFRQFGNDGFFIVPSVLAVHEIAVLLKAIDRTGGFRLGIGGKQFAIRNALDIAAISRLAADQRIRKLAESILGSDCVAVRALVFDKVAGANWKVPFHQDLTIEVQERLETPGFGPWSVKGGVHCVQPPEAVLQSMIAVRLHLDDTPMENGPLRVLPGSHVFGRLSPPQIERFRATAAEVCCLAVKGDALVIRPLLLHASSPATNVEHRRVLHIDFGPRTLPGGLNWHRAV